MPIIGYLAGNHAATGAAILALALMPQGACTAKVE
jgi:hypothetical protein